MGIPFPLFHTEILFYCGSIVILIMFIEGSLWWLSAALTNISSKQIVFKMTRFRKLTVNFEKTWNPDSLSVLHFVGSVVEHPEILSLLLDASDVGIRSQKNVLKLSLFLIGLLDSF